MSARTTLWAAVLGVLLGLCAAPGLAQQKELPGTRDAIERAIEAAAAEAADRVVEALPEGVSTVALFPLLGDPEGVASTAFEEAMTRSLSRHNLRLVTRSEAEWNRLTSEWKFTEDNFDVMPEIPDFRKVYPAGAMAWGRLRYARIDDSAIKAQARIEVKFGMPASGDVKTVTGNGLEAIDAGTFVTGTLMGLVRTPWFWLAIVGGIVAAVFLLVVSVPPRRKMRLAAKPREVVR